MLGRDCLNLYFTIDYIVVSIRLQTTVLGYLETTVLMYVMWAVLALLGDFLSL